MSVERATVAFAGGIAPAALSADTNDWAPTNVRLANRIDVSASAFITLTGLDATGAQDGEFKWLVNVGTLPINLAEEHAGSSAANRFQMGGASVVLAPAGTVPLMYSAAASRWRLLQPMARGRGRMLATSLGWPML